MLFAQQRVDRRRDRLGADARRARGSPRSAGASIALIESMTRSRRASALGPGAVDADHRQLAPSPARRRSRRRSPHRAPARPPASRRARRAAGTASAMIWAPLISSAAEHRVALVGEVLIEGAERDRRPRRDVVGAHRPVALLGDHRRHRPRDPFRRRVALEAGRRLALAARRGLAAAAGGGAHARQPAPELRRQARQLASSPR